MKYLEMIVIIVALLPAVYFFLALLNRRHTDFQCGFGVCKCLSLKRL